MKSANRYTIFTASILLSSLLLSQVAQAAIALDRTRVIFDGESKSTVMNISNNNSQFPYLAQGWIENAKSEKITSPLIVLPPVQRLEPGKSSQIKIEAMPAVKNLPQDRESLFYFNLREIPPKSDKPNTLQIALQTKIKLFYRPESIKMNKFGVAPQEKLTLSKQGDKVMVKNPTPYYISIIYAAGSSAVAKNKDFAPVMIPPFEEMPLGLNASALGNSPTLTYINDYGGRPTLNFQCQGNLCQVVPADNP